MNYLCLIFIDRDERDSRVWTLRLMEFFQPVLFSPSCPIAPLCLLLFLRLASRSQLPLLELWPSLGLQSLESIIRWMYYKEKDLSCIYLPLFVLCVGWRRNLETTYSCIVSLLPMCGITSKKGSVFILSCLSLWTCYIIFGEEVLKVREAKCSLMSFSLV